MHLHQLSHRIRKAREAKGLTQAGLADLAGLSRVTINQIENGVVADIGLRKFQRVLDGVGLTLAATPRPSRMAKDFLVMLCTTANTSHRNRMAPDDLAKALLSGRVPKGYAPHLRTALDEAPRSVLAGALEQLSSVKEMAQLRENVAAIAAAVSSSRISKL